jgi:hypothetical protein
MNRRSTLKLRMYGLLLTSLTRDHFALFHEDWPQLPQFSDSTYDLSNDHRNMYYYVPPRVTDKLSNGTWIFFLNDHCRLKDSRSRFVCSPSVLTQGDLHVPDAQVSHCRWCFATNAYITVGYQIQFLVSMVFPSQCSRVQKMAPCSTVLECESYWTQLVPRVVQNNTCAYY